MLHETVLLALENEGKFLLVKRNNRTWHDMWCFPGGHTECNETARQAGLREGMEEVGEVSLEAQPFARFTHPVPPGEKGRPTHEHDCSVFMGKVIGNVELSKENSEYRWATPDEMERMEITDYTKMAVEAMGTHGNVFNSREQKSSMKEAVGFGKTIIFGEHFVVYGVPSIAAAIGTKTMAKASKHSGRGVTIDDQRPETPGYKTEKAEQQTQALGLILKAMDISKDEPIKITLAGDLVAASGVGASAASCVAVARALAAYKGVRKTDEEINAIAFEGEKGYHGTPSGVDNSVSTFGGLIWFVKGQPNVIERIRMKAPFEIVIADTGLTTNTTKAVDGVRQRKTEEPERYGRLFRSAEELANKAKKALETYDLKETGRLMNENHMLLQQIGVSCKELDHLVDVAMKNGAYGAKMTGSGLGGNIVALTPGNELQDKVAKAIETAGFKVLRTSVGF